MILDDFELNDGRQKSLNKVFLLILLNELKSRLHLFFKIDVF